MQPAFSSASKYLSAFPTALPVAPRWDNSEAESQILFRRQPGEPSPDDCSRRALAKDFKTVSDAERDWRSSGERLKVPSLFATEA